MKQKWYLKASAMALAATLALSAAACATQTPGGAETPPATEPAAEATVYETSLSSAPISWNPHTWVSAEDMVMLEYVTTPFVVTAKDGEETVYIYEAAAAVSDITKDFADKEAWGIEAEAEEGYVYQIDLNPGLTFEDGTSVNADDYIRSMRSLLDPELRNFRTSRYSVGAEALRGALAYLNSNKAGQTKYASAMDAEITEDTVLYVGSYVNNYFLDNTMAYYAGLGFGPYFFNEDGENLIEKYAECLEVTDEIIAELTVIAGNFGDNNPEAWIEFCLVPDGVYDEASWEDVGLIKTGDYQFVFICENPMEEAAFMTLMKRNWLVNEAAYGADYNIPGGNTVSFGPYTLVSFGDGVIELAKNENWYGWAHTDDHQALYTYEEYGDFDLVKIAIPSDELSVGEATGNVHPFPFAFEATDLFGNTITQEALGEKELYFCHLWATWCGPCVQEMGDLAAIGSAYGDRVGFIGLVLDLNENPNGARKLAEHNNIPFINIYSETAGLEGLMEMLKSGYVPTTILIDGEGNIIGEQIIGSFGMEYADFIDAALEEVNK